MAVCKIDSGIINDCEDLLRVGGAFQTFWVGFISDLATPFVLSQAAPITAISFDTYGGLYRFDGNKFAHSFGSTLNVAAGGNKSFTHTFIAKMFSNSTPDDKTLQDLQVAIDMFIVAQNNNQELFILGAGNGLSASAGEQNTGQTADSDTTHNITLTGAEKTLPLRFLSVDYATSLALIEGYEI